MNFLNPVETTVSIAGKQIHFVHLKLSQRFFTSHHCEILVDFEELDERWLANPITMIKYIGESIDITFRHMISGETTVFSGIVTNVTMKGKFGTQNHILIQGADPSIKLSDSPTMDSFVDMSLNDIVKEAVGYSGNGVEITTNSNYKKPIDFTYQYNETCQQFINRLCYQYGENYYYNGTELIFGKTIIGDTYMIKYDSEMLEYTLDANLVPSKFKHYSYLVHDDQRYTKETQPVSESTGYLSAANDKSDEIYTTDAITPLDASVNDSDAILDIVKAKRKKTVANMLRLKGKTRTCKIGIGNIIQIEFPKDMQIETTEGEFIVTDVVHIVDQQGHYENEFSSVRQALNQVPLPDIALPTANPQQAKVTSNADPKNQGRVQVEFQWMEARGKTTNWVKVQTPDAGGSDKVASNRGLVTIPEKGDVVMVGFEFGNPDKPFSMGSIFTCKNGGGGGQDNSTKSLATRCGNAIILNDAKRSVTAKDPSGNTIIMDGGGNVTVNAPSSFKINCGGNEKGEGATCCFEMKADGSIVLKSGEKNIFTMTTTDTTLQTPVKVEVTSNTTSVTSEGGIAFVQNEDNSITINGLVDIDGSQVQVN